LRRHPIPQTRAAWCCGVRRRARGRTPLPAPGARRWGATTPGGHAELSSGGLHRPAGWHGAPAAVERVTLLVGEDDSIRIVGVPTDAHGRDGAIDDVFGTRPGDSRYPTPRRPPSGRYGGYAASGCGHTPAPGQVQVSPGGPVALVVGPGGGPLAQGALGHGHEGVGPAHAGGDGARSGRVRGTGSPSPAPNEEEIAGSGYESGTFDRFSARVRGESQPAGWSPSRTPTLRLVRAGRADRGEHPMAMDPLVGLRVPMRRAGVGATRLARFTPANECFVVGGCVESGRADAERR
jgi:hypothetical protein